MNGVEDAVDVVDGADADVCESRLLLLLLLHPNAPGTVVVVEKEAVERAWMESLSLSMAVRCT